MGMKNPKYKRGVCGIANWSMTYLLFCNRIIFGLSISLKESQLISMVEDLINLPVKGYRHPGFYLENFVWEGSFEYGLATWLCREREIFLLSRGARRFSKRPAKAQCFSLSFFME